MLENRARNAGGFPFSVAKSVIYRLPYKKAVFETVGFFFSLKLCVLKVWSHWVSPFCVAICRHQILSHFLGQSFTVLGEVLIAIVFVARSLLIRPL